MCGIPAGIPGGSFVNSVDDNALIIMTDLKVSLKDHVCMVANEG